MKNRRTFKITGYLIVLILSSFQCLSQAELTTQEVQQLLSTKAQVQGSYQVEMINTRSLPTIPLIAYKEIEQRRKQSEVVYYQLNENTRIKIFPFDQIKDPNFGFPEEVIYINTRSN